MIRCPPLPLLPGYTVPLNVGQTHFPKLHHTDFIGDGVRFITFKGKSGTGEGSKFPTVHARGETIDSPAWIAYDKKVLRFDAFYKETMFEQFGHNHVVHHCKIYFFLEDGTIKVVEPKVRNSGIPQGCLISRRRIKFPIDGDREDFYDILDFNIGKTVEFFGKVFKITNCDAFTRSFLNRLGIPVSDPVSSPPDPYSTLREQAEKPKKLKSGESKSSVFAKFLAFEGRILSFDAYWDDKQTVGGYLHLIKVHYFLCDDTMEIKDVTEPDRPVPLIKRSKLPKVFKGLPTYGQSENQNLLNVIGINGKKAWSLIDALNLGKDDPEFFTDKDLVIGATINAYGRRVVLIDCDNFTKEYYKAKYGLDDFTPAERPLTKREQEMAIAKEIVIPLPPYNGFGSHEDSETNCRSINPFSTMKSSKQFFEKDKDGYDSKIFRFSVKLFSKISTEWRRMFTLQYYLVDDTLAIFEHVLRNSGFKGGIMIGRRKILKPGENMFGNKPPECYRSIDLFVGNTLVVDGFKFQLTGADEYTLRYMELHSNEFPKSNAALIMQKVRTDIRPVYKDFAARFFVDTALPSVPYARFRDSLKAVLGDHITEHEILTLGRRFSVKLSTESVSLDTTRRIAHDILKRKLYNDFERLLETFRHHDGNKNGRVPVTTAYKVLRAVRLPVSPDIIKWVLQKHAKGEECEVEYAEVADFFNYRKYPVPAIAPMAIAENYSCVQLEKPEGDSVIEYVDIKDFIELLNLEEELKQQAK